MCFPGGGMCFPAMHAQRAERSGGLQGGLGRGVRGGGAPRKI